MRMDECLPATTPAEDEAIPTAVRRRASGGGGGVRFTSNVVGSLFLLADIVCFLIAAPLTLAAYSLVRGSRLDVSVHVTAFILMLGSFLLIRSSRQAYRRSLLDLSDNSDTTFDAVISSLIASALIWQAGLVEHYSRGITLLFLLTVVLCLSVSRPLLNRLITRPDRAAYRILWRRSRIPIAYTAASRLAQVSAPSLRRHRRRPRAGNFGRRLTHDWGFIRSL